MKKKAEKTETKKADKPKVEAKKVEKKVIEPKNYLTMYNGMSGKKAKTEKEAVDICKEYIASGKAKKASVYVFVKEIK
jgi:hypothetical protein